MNRPNLPQLDQVEFRNSWLMAEGFGSASTLGKVTTALGVVESILRVTELHQFTLYNHALALIVLGFTIYLVLFVAVHYVRSDERGLTIHRLLHHQFIKWDDIREVVVRHSQMCNEPDGYVFVGRDQRIWLPLSFPRRRVDVVLTASIRQHLLAVGKINNVPLLKEAEDLWWAAPDWVSSESEWTNNHAPDWKIYYRVLVVKSIVTAILLSLGTAVFGWERTKAVVILAVFFIGGLYAALYFFLYRMRTVAERVKVDSDGIEVVNGFGKFNLAWQNIKESGWDSEGLYLKARFPRIVRLPDNPSASELHLCILKKLRTLENHKWIEVPARLGGLTHAVMGTYSE